MDISSLRERREPSEITVSELNSYIKSILDNDKRLSAISVRGEISNFKRHSSGHLYFTLKDDGGQIRAVMFRSYADRIRFMPEDGMKVIVRAEVSVYAQAGTYQLYVNSMQPDGVGALYLAYEQLKERLACEGLFDQEHKIPLPSYPTRIGVITSPTGAAVRDIINVTGRRYPLATVYVYPALVQGDGAEKSLIEGLKYFEQSGLADVIIIGRGGGSIEDLWAFNGEELARCIYTMNTPVISAVGHETDFTICDFVADMRAPTPSAAAEIAVPDIRELSMRMDSLTDRVRSALLRKVERCEAELSLLSSSPVLSDPDRLFEDRAADISQLSSRAVSAVEARIAEAESKVAIAAGKANALSPLATLARGYSVAVANEKALVSIKNVSVGDTVSIILSDGELTGTVTDKNERK